MAKAITSVVKPIKATKATKAKPAKPAPVSEVIDCTPTAAELAVMYGKIFGELTDYRGEWHENSSSVDFQVAEVFQTCLSTQGAEARELLAQDIKAYGQRDGLVLCVIQGLYPNRLLLDGHNRLDVLSSLDILPRISQILYFGTLDEAKQWIYRNQLGRRNLTDEQRVLIMTAWYESLKDRPKAQDQNDPATGKALTIAQQMAVESDRSEATIKRDVRKGRVLKASGLDKDTASGVIKDIPAKVVEELEPLVKAVKTAVEAGEAEAINEAKADLAAKAEQVRESAKKNKGRAQASKTASISTKTKNTIIVNGSFVTNAGFERDMDDIKLVVNDWVERHGLDAAEEINIRFKKALKSALDRFVKA